MRAHSRPRNFIPDRGPGHAFVPITHCRLAAAHPGMRIGCLVGITWVPFVPSPATPLDSGLRRNDEWEAELPSAGAVECGDSANPHADPSGGQAPRTPRRISDLAEFSAGESAFGMIFDSPCVVFHRATFFPWTTWWQLTVRKTVRKGYDRTGSIFLLIA